MRRGCVQVLRRRSLQRCGDLAARTFALSHAGRRERPHRVFSSYRRSAELLTCPPTICLASLIVSAHESQWNLSGSRSTLRVFPPLRGRKAFRCLMVEVPSDRVVVAEFKVSPTHDVSY